MLSVRREASWFAIVTLVMACSGQSLTQTPFEQAASDAASIFSAAAQTLRFIHEEPVRLTVEYGTGAMIIYYEQVSGTPDELPKLEGAPDSATVDQIVATVERAAADLQEPCLVPDCDWASQLERIDQARDSLLAAIE